MHVQSVQNYCFSLSDMQICDIVAVIVVMDSYLNAVAVHVRHNNMSLRIDRYVARII